MLGEDFAPARKCTSRFAQNGQRHDRSNLIVSPMRLNRSAGSNKRQIARREENTCRVHRLESLFF